jgi:hypothetical protein
MRFPSLALAALGMLGAAPALGQPFSYLPPGDLVAGSGQGREDYTIYAPGIRFPIEQTPAYANSQVYMNGGMYGPGGGQCDAVNYSYPWRDNYCEIRSWDMPLCPSGTGHQGQDIRPATCNNSAYWAVATTAGTITHIGSYSVYLTAADGTRYDYLHMSTVQVAEGNAVARGDRLGMVSNQFGGTPTTIHLHFNIQQAVGGVGTVYVPPYMSLVAAYQAMVNGPPEGELEQVGCDLIRGWAFDPDTSNDSVGVLLTFDGALGEAGAIETPVTADEERPDRCDGGSPCARGFAIAPPLALFDGADHAVHAYARDTADGSTVELAQSPATLRCSLGELAGVRRPADDAALGGWHLSRFWDRAVVSPAVLEALPLAVALGAERTIVSNAQASSIWALDQGLGRPVTDAQVAAAWRIEPAMAEPWTQADLAALPQGPPLRPRPMLLAASTAAEAELYLLDDPLGGAAGAGAGAGAGGDDAGDAAGLNDGDDGCSCRIDRGRRHEGAPGWAALALATALARLRRRGRAPRA